MMGYFGFGAGPGAGLFGAGFVGMLLMALFWIALVAVLIWAVVRFIPRDRRSDREAARDIVGRRYAAGEITEAEYQQAMRTLGAD